MVTPPAVSEQLAQRLGGTVHRVPDAGHFLDREGFTELPVVLQAVEDVVQGAEVAAR
jgi:esterase